MTGAGAGRWRRWAGAVALALGVALAAPAPAPAAAWGAPELRELAADYVRGRLERHPETGTAMGERSHDERLASGTPAARDEERRWLEALAAGLGQIPRDALEPSLRLERDLLETRLDADRFALDVEQAWTHDPGAVLRSLRRALTGAAAEGRGDCARVQAVTRRLRAVPERLRTAMVDVVAPEREATVRAIAEAGSLVSLQRAGFGFGQRTCRDGRTQADFAVADSAALRAVEEYRAFLEQGVLPRAVPGRPWGRERLAAWLGTTQRERFPVASLAERARGEIAVLRAGLAAGADADTAAATGRATPAGGRDHKRKQRLSSDLRRLAAAEALPDEAARRAWELASSPEALAADPSRFGPVVARDLALLELGRARRLCAVLALHADGLDSAATAAWLVSEALAEPADAARETAAARDDPSIALEALRSWRLRDVRDETMAWRGSAFDAEAFADAVRAVGPLPSGLLRASVLGALGISDERVGRQGR